MLNYTQTFKIKGESVLFTVRYGVISIKGIHLNHIKMNKEHGNFIYLDERTTERIKRYKGMKPKEFLLELIKEEKVKIDGFKKKKKDK